MNLLDFGTRILVDRIPADGRSLSVKADAEQLAALAERFGVDEVTGFSAEILAKRFRGGVRVTGLLEGGVVQPCVVTGEPVASRIEEEVDRAFLSGRDAAAEATPGAEIFVDLEQEDFPDWYEGNELDLDAVLMESFALAIPLYPRAPGAALPEDAGEEDEEETSPFAALKALKRDE